MIKHTKESLQAAVSQCTTWTDVCRHLGLAPKTGSQSHLRKRADYYGVDYTHFVGQSSTKGKPSLRKRPLSDYFEGKAKIKSAELRRRLIKEKYKEDRCENCFLTEWMGQKIPLELDHVDGNHENNRLDNLKILCPNCHAMKHAPVV